MPGSNIEKRSSLKVFFVGYKFSTLTEAKEQRNKNEEGDFFKKMSNIYKHQDKNVLSFLLPFGTFGLSLNFLEFASNCAPICGGPHKKTPIVVSG